MKFNRVFEIAGSIVLLAGIFLLVRPGSQGIKMVSAFGASFADILQGATGAQDWNGNPTKSFVLNSDGSIGQNK